MSEIDEDKRTVEQFMRLSHGASHRTIAKHTKLSLKRARFIAERLVADKKLDGRIVDGMMRYTLKEREE